jgi:hypothetical protein
LKSVLTATHVSHEVRPYRKAGTMPAQPQSDTISTARIERALVIVARLVAASGGEAFVPVFERLEAEGRRRANDARARAAALAQRSTAIPTPAPSSQTAARG